MRTPEDNMRSEEASAMADCVGRLEKELIEHNEGRNKECWPLNSFGWKHADLDPEGCCGISKVTAATDETVTVEIGGHKTFCDPAYEIEDEDKQAQWRSVAQHYIEGAAGNGDWTGEEWVFSFSDEIKIDWVEGEDDTDFPATAQLLIAKAKEACKPYEKNWSEISAALDRVYADITREFG
jgi:hypothetical protein